MNPDAPIFGGIESGGTKFVCALGDARSSRLLAREKFDTTDDPQGVLAKVIAWLKDAECAHGRLAAIGVASFGPLDLDSRSPTYGFITTTPKRGWRDTDILGPLRRAFPGLPLGLDTDVNGAAVGEGRWGAAVGLDDFVYITVGTGIGGGAIVRGRPVHGLVHPEMGHMPLPRVGDDTFAGACRIHGRCWEGLCAGPAFIARTGKSAEELDAGDPAWDLAIRSMAHALATITCVLSPRRIVVGGSVRKGGRLGETEFFARLRRHHLDVLNGYIASPALDADAAVPFIVPPALGDDAGVCGAIALALEAASPARGRA